MYGLNSFLFKACRLYVEHLYNANDFLSARIKHNNDHRLKGVSSRLLQHLLHPEQDLVFKGMSKSYFLSKQHLHVEHIVPMVFIQNMIFDVLEDKVTIEHSSKDNLIDALAKKVYQCLGIAFITKEESKLLDKAGSLKQSMPASWEESNDPICRLHAVGIELVDADGNEIKTLKVELPNIC
jgi:hypothetical protein